MPVDGVFETAFQSAPLDLPTDAFYTGTSEDPLPTISSQSLYVVDSAPLGH